MAVPFINNTHTHHGPKSIFIGITEGSQFIIETAKKLTSLG